MLSRDDFFSKSDIIRLILLMSISVLSIYYIERRNESHFLPDSTYVRGIIND